MTLSWWEMKAVNVTWLVFEPSELIPRIGLKQTLEKACTV